MVDQDRFSNDKDYESFFDLKNQLIISNDNDFNRFHSDPIEAKGNDRKTWLMMNEVRNLKNKT